MSDSPHKDSFQRSVPNLGRYVFWFIMVVGIILTFSLLLGQCSHQPPQGQPAAQAAGVPTATQPAPSAPAIQTQAAVVDLCPPASSTEQSTCNLEAGKKMQIMQAVGTPPGLDLCINVSGDLDTIFSDRSYLDEQGQSQPETYTGPREAWDFVPRHDLTLAYRMVKPGNCPSQN